MLECIEPPEGALPSIDEDFLGDAITPIKYDHDKVFGVPTLEELGKYILYDCVIHLFVNYIILDIIYIKNFKNVFVYIYLLLNKYCILYTSCFFTSFSTMV